MVKCNTILQLFLCQLIPFLSAAQMKSYWQERSGSQVGSIKQVLMRLASDSFALDVNRRRLYYQEIDRPLALHYFKRQLLIARKTKQRLWEAEALSTCAPTVSIATKKVGNQVEIRISDNGNGIPQHIIDKIFQPFFTIKPTGQGTGLSMAYDSITKGHGGELSVDTKETEGTVLTIKI